ncbi:unnamed protein product [Rhizophagus irregularis]|nr:unnamed protein product [Rhizophagus irregularis]
MGKRKGTVKTKGTFQRFGGSLDNPEFNISKWPLLSAPSIEGYGARPTFRHTPGTRRPLDRKNTTLLVL